jgi:LuxR family transcriptional regulator, maltose regulon positive regulatory protein
VEEVLSRQPAPVQQFLLQTSIFEQLCAPLCDAVTGADATSQATLETLERANIFTIPLDDEQRWYRYHHLFANLLRIRLGQNHPEMVANLHRRAAAWLNQHGQPTAAVQHALAAQDFPLAADLLQANSGARWAVSDIGFLNLLAQLPVDVLQARPSLGIHRTWTLVLQSRLEEADSLLASLEPHLSAMPCARNRSAARFCQPAERLHPRPDGQIRALGAASARRARTHPGQGAGHAQQRRCDVRPPADCWS